MAVNLTKHDLSDLASNILATDDLNLRNRWIHHLQRTNVGSEALRLIVRDNVGGAAAAVADALWVNL